MKQNQAAKCGRGKCIAQFRIFLKKYKTDQKTSKTLQQKQTNSWTIGSRHATTIDQHWPPLGLSLEITFQPPTNAPQIVKVRKMNAHNCVFLLFLCVFFVCFFCVFFVSALFHLIFLKHNTHKKNKNKQRII